MPPGDDRAARRRLSACALWRAQRRFFVERGPGAFERGLVPQYVTSNSFVAFAYARLLLAYERDARASGWLAPGAPLTVVELGAGTGRLAHHLLRGVDALGGAGRLRYVLTDVSEGTLAGWERHPRLAPRLAAGALDLATFDAERDDRLVLRRAGVALEPGGLAGPLVVVANYVLDGLPQDAFRFGPEGQVEELLVASEAHGDDLASARLELAAAPAGPAPYGDPEWDALVRGYAGRFARPAAVTLPIAALACLRRLAALPAGGRLALLAADRGDHRLEALGDPRDLDLARHGSVSMRVNFHALGAWVAARGGRAFVSDAGPEHLDVGLYALGAGALPETARTFREAVAGFGPDDFYTLKRALVARAGALTLPEALAALRLSGWDPDLFRDLAPALLRGAPDATPGQARDLERAAGSIWDGRFPPLDDATAEGDLALDLALVLHAAGRDEAALGFVDLAGSGPEAARWRAACLRRLGRGE